MICEYATPSWRFEDEPDDEINVYIPGGHIIKTSGVYHRPLEAEKLLGGATAYEKPICSDDLTEHSEIGRAHV